VRIIKYQLSSFILLIGYKFWILSVHLNNTYIIMITNNAMTHHPIAVIDTSFITK